MRPQFFPWLFDDKNAWEKSLGDPRYSYELPIDNFMALYQIERKVNGENVATLPVMSAMPLPAAAPSVQTFATTTPFVNMSHTVASAQQAPVIEKPKQEDGILSQDEIDALLSGL